MYSRRSLALTLSFLLLRIQAIPIDSFYTTTNGLTQGLNLISDSLVNKGQEISNRDLLYNKRQDGAIGNIRTTVVSLPASSSTQTATAGIPEDTNAIGNIQTTAVPLSSTSGSINTAFAPDPDNTSPSTTAVLSSALGSVQGATVTVTVTVTSVSSVGTIETSVLPSASASLSGSSLIGTGFTSSLVTFESEPLSSGTAPPLSSGATGVSSSFVAQTTSISNQELPSTAVTSSLFDISSTSIATAVNTVTNQPSNVASSTVQLTTPAPAPITSSIDSSELAFLLTATIGQVQI
ncbi:hypothetical protein PNOK_0324200 [Pyrrhoderma noxium]|uniref:Uncharacterized protein n=1 Tax=Pyrrhoderma noxium TaxID=2282107 RepID=A0A286UME1_9AGAM|nr:hypothetical protein PNOK_0324200 [Pyrrhoderma noxium]